MTHRSQLAGLIIDCETNDFNRAARFWSDAEVARLEQLGARRVKQIPGQRFCVVALSRANFDRAANRWR